MDEDIYTIPTSLTHIKQPHNNIDFIHTNVVSIFVDSEWSGGSGTSECVIQHCPAIYIPSPLQIPQTVKHIYSRLAASANELDQGVPELLISLVGTGNSFSFENSERLERGLCQLFGRCGLWVITNGEHNDPLAYTASKALRSALLQRDNPEETLLIGINSANIHNISTKETNYSLLSKKEPSIHMVDSRINTLYLIWNKNNPNEQSMMIFRASLLIGVPEEKCSISGSLSHSQTPISAPNSPTTILLSSSLSNERKPLPLLIFCGVNLSSLLELVIYSQCGVPSLVVQDISELCVLIKSAFSLFQSSVFEHNSFEFWLERELRMVALATTGRYLESEIIEAKNYLFQLLLTVSTSEHSLLAFLPAHKLDKISEEALDLLIRSAPEVNEWARPLELACKLGISSPLNFICLEGQFNEKQYFEFLFISLKLPENERLNILSSLLNQNIPLPINSEFLIKWANESENKHFFNFIILDHFLGIKHLDYIDENISYKFNQFVTELSDGLCNNFFFLPELFSTKLQNQQNKDLEISFRIFSFWSLFLLQTENVLLFCAHSNDPMALSIILAKCSKELSNKCNQWIFYKKSLKRLSNKLINFSLKILNSAQLKSQSKAYNYLCRPLPSAYRKLTLIQLAFEANANSFILHECCQHYIQNFLYGQINVQKTICNFYIIPDWIKILMSSLFVFPIIFWIRPNIQENSLQRSSKLQTSPTVALLEDGRYPNNVRSSSANNSIHSLRSAQFGCPIGGRGEVIEDRRSNSGVLIPVDTVNIGNEGIDETDQINQMNTNDNSTVTDSFLPSASQMRSVEDNRTVMLEIDRKTHNQPRKLLSSKGQRLKQTNVLGSRRPSPDRRSLMFCDGGGSGSFSERSRRQSRSSRLLLGSNSAGAAGIDGGGTSFTRLLSPRVSLFLPVITTPKTLALFYSTSIVKYLLSLTFRIIYLIFLCWSVAQPGCFISGWIEQFLWLWALCWLIDSIWVLICWGQLINWNGKRFSLLIDIILNGIFLSLLLIIRLLITYYSSNNGRYNNKNNNLNLTYELRIFWAFFILYEFIRTLFIYLPLFSIIGQLLVKIKILVFKILLPFLLFYSLLIIISTIILKSTLFPDLSAQPAVLSETFIWTFKQLFTSDLNVLHQSSECQRQLLPEKRPSCQSLGGYANPRCPSQHWIAKLSLVEFLAFLHLFCWPLFLTILISSAWKLEKKNVKEIWISQRYALAISFSLRPCLPPPLTPFSLIILACCRFGASNDFSCYSQNTSNDYINLNNYSSQNSSKRKYCTVQNFRYKTNGGFWSNLAINLWNNIYKENVEIKQTIQKTEHDKTSLLLDFNSFTQRLLTEKETKWEYIEGTLRLKIDPSLRNWLKLLPNYRPNNYSLPIDQFPLDIQKNVQDVSIQNILEIGRQWRQKRLSQFLSLIEKGENILNNSIILNGNGLPLNPKGRCGLGGRGNFSRFGPNILLQYAIFQRYNNNDNSSSCSNLSNSSVNSDKTIFNVLVQQFPSDRLPSRWSLSPSPQMVDEFLAQLLLQLGLPDPDIHTISCKTNLLPGQKDGNIAVINGDNIQNEQINIEDKWPEWPKDTDNAWTEINKYLIKF